MRGFKTIAKNVDEDDIVRAVREGDDVIVRDQQTARRVARAAGDGKPPVGPESHRITGGERGRPHYHMNGRSNSSHIFYSAASALTIQHYTKDASPLVQKAAGLADFFNPLSLPKDVLDAVAELKKP